jgi:hypothetical protein
MPRNKDCKSGIINSNKVCDYKMQPFLNNKKKDRLLSPRHYNLFEGLSFFVKLNELLAFPRYRQLGEVVYKKPSHPITILPTRY